MFLTNFWTKFNFFPIFSGFATLSHYHTGLRNPGTPVPSMDHFFCLVMLQDQCAILIIFIFQYRCKQKCEKYPTPSDWDCVICYEQEALWCQLGRDEIWDEGSQTEVILCVLCGTNSCHIKCAGLSDKSTTLPSSTFGRSSRPCPNWWWLPAARCFR